MVQWNMKPCKCKLCGLEFESVVSGRAHVWVKHNINSWKETRQHIERTDRKGDEVSVPKDEKDSGSGVND